MPRKNKKILIEMCDKAPVRMTTLTPQHSAYERMQQLRAFYQEHFTERISFYVRVPGRVNLIGEHVDYCGYPVLPMALEQCILLAVGLPEISDKDLKLRNMNVERFPDCDFDLTALNQDNPISYDAEQEWYRYFFCGYKGTTRALPTSQPVLGMRVAISSDIPPAAGLASSSALVSAAVLAASYVHNLSLECHELANVAACCERYIGTDGGGMDQAIAFLARKDCAQFIEFYPNLLDTPIKLPDEACFVVANSLISKNKAVSSDFNERVVECRLSTRLLAKYCCQENWRDITRLIHLQEALGVDLTQMERLIKQHLNKQIYTRDILLELFDVTETTFTEHFLTPDTQHMTQFKLNDRALHVIQESMRVQKFRGLCEAEKRITTSDRCNVDVVAVLSKLMRASHRSLKTLYECSHPQLDLIISISDKEEVGARLTGAGWGGFIVALCPNKSKATRYMNVLKEEYYQKITPKPSDLANVVFATKASEGAELIFPKYLINPHQN